MDKVVAGGSYDSQGRRRTGHLQECETGKWKDNGLAYAKQIPEGICASCQCWYPMTYSGGKAVEGICSVG